MSCTGSIPERHIRSVGIAFRNVHLLVKAEIFAVDVGEVGGHYHIVVKCCIENGFDIFIICINLDNRKLFIPGGGSLLAHIVKAETVCFFHKVEHCVLCADKTDAYFKLNTLILEVAEIYVD